MWWMQQRCAHNHTHTAANDVKNASPQLKISIIVCVCGDRLCYVKIKRKLNSLPKLSVSDRIMDLVAFLFSSSHSHSLFHLLYRLRMCLRFSMFYFPTFNWDEYRVQDVGLCVCVLSMLLLYGADAGLVTSESECLCMCICWIGRMKQHKMTTTTIKLRVTIKQTKRHLLVFADSFPLFVYSVWKSQTDRKRALQNEQTISQSKRWTVRHCYY